VRAHNNNMVCTTICSGACTWPIKYTTMTLSITTVDHVIPSVNSQLASWVRRDLCTPDVDKQPEALRLVYAVSSRIDTNVLLLL